jgi:hypothetical protein
VALSTLEQQKQRGLLIGNCDFASEEMIDDQFRFSITLLKGELLWKNIYPQLRWVKLLA